MTNRFVSDGVVVSRRRKNIHQPFSRSSFVKHLFTDIPPMNTALSLPLVGSPILAPNADDEPLIQELFNCSMDIFKSVGSPCKRKSRGDTAWKSWRNERERLAIWGDGFGVSSGELDTVLDDRRSHFRTAVVSVLARIIACLLHGLCSVNPLSIGNH